MGDDDNGPIVSKQLRSSWRTFVWSRVILWLAVAFGGAICPVVFEAVEAMREGRDPTLLLVNGGALLLIAVALAGGILTDLLRTGHKNVEPHQTYKAVAGTAVAGLGALALHEFADAYEVGRLANTTQTTFILRESLLLIIFIVIAGCCSTIIVEIIRSTPPGFVVRDLQAGSRMSRSAKNLPGGDGDV